MIADYLSPVSKELQSEINQLNDASCFGKKIIFDHTIETSKAKIVLLGINLDENEKELFQQVRKWLYELRFGDWHTQLYDIGDLILGNEESDTLFAFNSACQYFLKQNASLIILGNESRLIPWQHSVFGNKKPKNLVTIDAKISIGNIDETLNNSNYLGKLIQSNFSIGHYSNIGHQTYYVSKEEIGLMNQLNYDCFRLGELIEDIKQITPVFQNAHSVSINLNALQNHYDIEKQTINPNGINSRELCDLTYHAGIGNDTQILGFFNYTKQNRSNEELIAQAIWYFIEGINNRHKKKSFDSSEFFEKYNLPFHEKNILFYKDRTNNNWWVNIDNIKEYHPCSYRDYEMAVNYFFTKRIENLLKKTKN